MGLLDLVRGSGMRGGSAVTAIDTSEHFAIPLKRIEEDRMGLRNGVMTLEKDLSVMVLGQPGSGKTSTITFLAKQMQATTQDPVVIFDYKGDYAEKGIYDPDDAIILAFDGSTNYWNVFEEATHRRDYRTIAQALFQEDSGSGDASNEFFTRGAQDLFWACLRHVEEDPSVPNPSNEDLIEFIYPQSSYNGPPFKRIYETLERSADPDVRAAASELNPGNMETTTNMYQTLRKRVREVFDGDFARDGEFSIREYMEDPRGRTLVLDMSGPEQDVMAPIFRVFLDWSMRLALNDTSQYSYFILDEFDEVGELQQIQRMLSTGRAQKTEAVIGVQSRSQLRSVYGEDDAETILSNCPQKILMRTADDKEYVREQIGKEKYEIEQMGYGAQSASLTGSWIFQMLALARDSPQVQENEKYPIEEQEIGSFDRGEGVFLTEKGWVRGRFPLWEELNEEARAHLAGSQPNPSRESRSSPIRLTVGSERINVDFDEPVGQRIREAYERDGGDPSDAAYVHREHVKFSRSGTSVRMTVLGRNDTELEGRTLERGETVEVTDGDRLRLADRIEVRIDVP